MRRSTPVLIALIGTLLVMAPRQGARAAESAATHEGCPTASVLKGGLAREAVYGQPVAPVALRFERETVFSQRRRVVQAAMPPVEPQEAGDPAMPSEDGDAIDCRDVILRPAVMDGDTADATKKGPVT